jgi:hypothetical protein
MASTNGVEQSNILRRSTRQRQLELTLAEEVKVDEAQDNASIISEGDFKLPPVELEGTTTTPSLPSRSTGP